jgi:hypothetical protein
MLPALIGVGVGVVGTAGFIGFGLTARAGDRALDACTPDCSREQVDDVRRDYFLSNLSLGVAAAGFLGAGVSLLLSPATPPKAALSRANLRLRLGQLSYLTGEF